MLDDKGQTVAPTEPVFVTKTTGDLDFSSARKTIDGDVQFHSKVFATLNPGGEDGHDYGEHNIPPSHFEEIEVSDLS